VKKILSAMTMFLVLTASSSWAVGFETFDTGLTGLKPAVEGNLIAYSSQLDCGNYCYPSRIEGTLSYYDMNSGENVDTGFPTYCAPTIEKNTIAFIAMENQLNRDLNGDGDIRYGVGKLFTYNALNGEFHETEGLTDECPAPSIAKGEIVYGASEKSIIGDLNGDGIVSGNYLQGLYDVSSDTVSYLPDIAAGEVATMDRDHVVYLDFRAETDVDGNGVVDYRDNYRPTVYDKRTGETVAINVRTSDYPTVDNHVMSFMGYNPSISGYELYYYDIDGGTLVNTGIRGMGSSARSTAISNGRILFFDLDKTLNLYDIATGTVTYTGVPTISGPMWPSPFALDGDIGVYETVNKTIGIIKFGK